MTDCKYDILIYSKLYYTYLDEKFLRDHQYIFSELNANLMTERDIYGGEANLINVAIASDSDVQYFATPNVALRYLPQTLELWRGRESGVHVEASTTTFENVRRDMSQWAIRRGARYVIWPRDLPITVCATCLDIIDKDTDLCAALQRAVDWVAKRDRIILPRSIIVFDLDKTLIDAECEMYADVGRLLVYARATFDYVVLWTHGNSDHCSQQQALLELNYKNFCNFDESATHKKLFDLALCLENDDHSRPYAKNLLHLYNYFNGCHFKNPTLVDDTLTNWTPEYKFYIIPNYRNTVLSAKKALQCMTNQ